MAAPKPPATIVPADSETRTARTTSDGRNRTEGQRLLRLLTASGAEIARKVGVSAPLITYWRKGDKLPGPDKRRALEEHWGIPAAAWDQRPQRQEPEEAQDEPERPERSEPRASSPEPATGQRRRAVGHPSLAQVQSQIALLERRMEDPAISDDALARFVSQHTQLLKLQATLQGDARTDEERLAQSAAWAAVEAALARGLTGYPEAAESVARELAALGFV